MYQFPFSDFGALWRSRRWRLLLNLIDGLPPNSFYRAALMNDEDYIRAVLDFADENEDYSPPGELYSPTDGRLDQLIEELRALRAEAVMLKGGKPGKPKMQPRPKTAIEAVEAAKDNATYDWLVGELLRDRPEGAPPES